MLQEQEGQSIIHMGKGVKNRTSGNGSRRVRYPEERSTTITSYAQLCRYVDAFARGYLNLVILTGAYGARKDPHRSNSDRGTGLLA